MAQTQTPERAPLLPLMTALLLLWHLALAADYANARFVMDADLPQLTAALVLGQLWSVVGWGLAVWLGLAGALFMVWRDDASVLLLFAAAVSAAVAVTGDLLAGGTGDLLGMSRLAVLVALVAVPLVGWLYALARHASGHLT